MRLDLDTNQLVSGVIATGSPRRLLDGAKAGEFELCTSEALLAELPRCAVAGEVVRQSSWPA